MQARSTPSHFAKGAIWWALRAASDQPSDSPLPAFSPWGVFDDVIEDALGFGEVLVLAGGLLHRSVIESGVLEGPREQVFQIELARPPAQVRHVKRRPSQLHHTDDVAQLTLEHVA